jgi:hypothetical protein
MSSNATPGLQTLVSSYVTGNQFNPAITTLDDGGWVVTWEGEGPGDNYGIFEQRYRANGSAIGTEKLVNTYTTDGQTFSAVTALSDGGWLVTWSGEDAGDAAGILQQRYDSHGNQVTTDTLVNTHTTGGQTTPTVSAFAHGGWIETWYGEGDNDSFGIFQQRYGTHGGLIGTERQVNTYTTGSQFLPAVTTLSDGGWVVTWFGFGSNDASTYDIYQQHYGSDGDAVGGETLVDSYTTGYQYSNAVASLAKGGWLVTWDGEGSGDPDGIYQQRYNASGHTVGSETKINTYTTGDQYNSAVTVFDDGGWLVTWQGAGAKDTAGIFQQRYDSHGDKIGTETLVNSYTAGTQQNPTVTTFADGSWVVSWEGEGANGKIGIFERRFATDISGTQSTDDLKGTMWSEKLIGLAGHDTLDGGKGDDTLSGGADSDRFVFKTNYDADVITDFDAKGQSHDVLDLRGLNSIKDFAALAHHHMVQDGHDVVINGGHGDTITLEGVKINALVEHDFLI